jgi:hypothetical protein
MVARRQPENPGSSREPWGGFSTARIDWLAGRIDPYDNSLPEGATRDLSAVRSWLLDEILLGVPERGRGFLLQGYNEWFQDAFGGKVAIARDKHKRPTQAFVVLKGSPLGAHRSRGVGDGDLIEKAAAWRFVARRIDLAVDVRHERITPRAIYALHTQGRTLTRLRKREDFITNHSDGGTCFRLFGDDQLLRVYDKSAERERKGENLPEGITRFELELCGDLACRAFADLLEIARAGTWQVRFPRYVCELILSKFRPLAERRPARNPQRAKTWPPIVEAFAASRGVPLGQATLEQERSVLNRFAPQVNSAVNLARTLAKVAQAGGRESIERLLEIGVGRLTPQDRAELAILEQHPDGVQSLLREALKAPSVLRSALPEPQP